jgi:hypothetical protein
MSDPLIDKTDEQLLRDAEAALKEVFAGLDEGTWSLDHAEDCPEDDTCECIAGKIARQASDALNAIEYRLRFARGTRLAPRGSGPVAHKVKQLDGNKVVTECNEVHHHEHWFPVTETRAGIVLHRGDIPGCFLCYPEEQDDFLPPGTHLAIHGCIHRDGTRTKNIGCMDTGRMGWTLRAAAKAADEGDPGAIVEVIKRRDCPTHGIGGEEGYTEADFGPGGKFHED